MKNNNPSKVKFKKILVEYVRGVAIGSSITDTDLQTLATINGIPLNLQQIQTCVREAEKKIGSELMVRLKREKKFGYVVLTPQDQVILATEESRNKIVKTLNVTYKRFGYVNLNKLTPVERHDVILKQANAQTLLHVITSTTGKSINTDQIKVLNTAVSELSVLELMKKAGA